MKARGTTAALILLASLASIFAAPASVLHAAPVLYFDAEGGTKPWDYFSPYWSATSGSPYDQTWSDDSSAYFEGTGGVVNVPNMINSVNSITFGVNGYTIGGSPGAGALMLTGTGGNITTHEGVTATIQSIINGSNGLTKLGAGTLELLGYQLYTGDTTISEGTLRLLYTPLPTSTSVVLANTAGAALDINGYNSTFASLNGGGTNGGNVLLGSGNLQVTTGNYGGVISGSGDFVVGAVTLSGANTYTGETYVSGTLTLSAERVNQFETTAFRN